MRNLLLLACVGLMPVIALTGYLAGDKLNSPPTLEEHIAQGLRSDGGPEVLYLFIYHDDEVGDRVLAAEDVLPVSDKELRANGLESWRWMKVSCSTWSSSGDPQAVDDPESITRCRQTEITRKQALDGASKQQAPPGVPQDA